MVTNERNTAIRVKQLRYQSDPATVYHRLDDHHIVARFQGGNGDLENNFGLTLPEHTIIHLLEADLAPNPRTQQKHIESARLITCRQDRSVFQTCLQMLAKIEKRHLPKISPQIYLDTSHPDPVDYAVKHHQVAINPDAPASVARRSAGLVKVMVAGMSQPEKIKFNQLIAKPKKEKPQASYQINLY